MGTRITGTGHSVPEKTVSNEDLAKTLDTSDEWIRSRTGIGSRHIAQAETTVSLASAAAAQAVEMAGLRKEEIELVIVATSSPDYAFPNTAALVQKQIGAIHAACFDLSAACTGFIYALNTAEAFIRAGQYTKVLVIGSEVLSRQVDWEDRSVCVLFGDGAGAVVLEQDDNAQNESSYVLHSDGSLGHVLTCGQTLSVVQTVSGPVKMDGQAVFKFAVKRVPESILEVLNRSDQSVHEIRYFILHQANVRIIESVAKRLGLGMERFPTNLDCYGNTSAASIPILLDEMNRAQQLRRGDKIILSGFGAGLSWGSALLTW